MKKFTFLVLVTTFQMALAQTPSWQWGRSAGYGGNESTSAVAVDASGNVFGTGGYTSSNIVFGATNLINPGVGTSDIFLVKYDASGNVLWAKTFGGASGEVGNAIATDAIGNAYITGLFTSSVMTIGTVTLTNTSTTGSDVFVAKLDPSGNTIWAKSAGGTAGDKGNGIAVDATGNVYVTGNFNSVSINFGTGAISNAGTNDVFIVKYDQSGNAMWSKNAGGSGDDAGNGIAIDATGGVYVTGYFSSSSINFGTGNLTNASSGTQDLFVVKYTSAGTAVWSARSGGSLDDPGTGIAVSKNNVYVTGAFNSATIVFGTTTLTNSSAGTSDFLLAKYDLGGNPGWAKRAGGSDYDGGNTAACDSLGNVYVTGYFVSSSLNFGSNTVNNSTFGTKDLFVVAYNGTGVDLWGIAAGGSATETGNGMAVSLGGTDIIMGGSFDSPSLTFGPSTVFKGCGEDVLVAKLVGGAVGIEENTLTDKLKAYPNPASTKFTIEAEGKVIFYNALGEEVNNYKQNTIKKGKTEFDLSALEPGVYLYRVTSDKKTIHTGRVIVQ